MSENWEEEERNRKARSHQEALVAAKRGKAILSPDHSNRQFVFATVGAVLLASLLASFLALSFGIGPGLIFGVVVICGFLLGAVLGLYYFHATHVIDESLEASVFEHYHAHRTVRDTYFKR
jgi:hypothetical protein